MMMGSGGGAGVTIATPPSAAAGAKKTNPQFVRAIGYVKKIKQRFASQPEIYKSFLASLHSYHREQKSIFDVYMEVADLFNGNVDLLEEFVLFLPESEATSITTRLSQQQLEIQQAGSGGVSRKRSSISQQQQQHPLPPQYQQHQQPLYESQQLQQQQQPPPPLSKMSKRAKKAQRMISSTQKGAEEASFYEGVKRHLGDKQAYGEFLKCLNLFCQGIIKINDLLHLVRRFIGGNADLFAWFKGYIGVKDAAMSTTTITNSSLLPPSAMLASPSNQDKNGDHRMIWRAADGSLLGSGGSAAGGSGGELNIHSLKRFGSYRIYPKSYRLPLSSKRTAIGLETLQDSLVSCAVFPTEDSTFIASKKNPYEEALFKCEDERFEMDLLIDGNQAAIAVLEPLSLKLEKMTKEQLKSFLFDGKKWGGSSEILYQKAIRKVYGDRTEEVLKGLAERPHLAVPVILKRLKAKDEEWRRVQRDWNRVWRDVHLRNYYKALDHQGLEIRNADKRSINGRVLIQECSKEAAGNGLEYCFAMKGVTGGGLSSITKDLLKLLKSVVKESGGSVNGGGSLSNWGSMDRKAVMRFLATFLPSFLISNGSTADNVLLFANNNLYVLVRLLQIAIERLQKLYVASSKSAGLPFIEEKLSVVKTFFGAHEHPVDSLGFAIAASSEGGARGVGGDGGAHSFYEMMLVLLKQVIRNELDPVTFEERVRFMFGTSAYHVFTMDKLLLSIVKQVHSVLQDSCCEQLIRLFDNWNCDRSNQGGGCNISNIRSSEYGARMAVDSVVPNTPKEGIFRIEWNPSTFSLSIIKLERLSNSINASSGAGVNQIDESGGATSSQWSEYINKFITGTIKDEQEEVDGKKKNGSRVFLKRCKRPLLDEKNIIIQYNLECKIALNTYKLFYVEHTEDFLCRL